MKGRTRLYLILFSLCALLFVGLLWTSLSSQTRFTKFCDSFFAEELKGNSLTLHYTLSDPKAYGITQEKVTLGTYDFDVSAQKRKLLKNFFILQTIARGQLSKENQKAYDCLSYCFKTELDRLDFYLLEEPLVPSIGIQSQLPVLLAEYSFQTEKDVENYLSLLKCIPDYFASLLRFEEERLENGLFMDEATAGELITYCQDFLNQKETHFLKETFEERLEDLPLDTEKKQSYIKKHASILERYVFPSYETLQSFLSKHEKDGHNADGLFYEPQGTDYYQWLLRSEIGTTRSFEEIETMLNDALTKDAKIIAALTKKDPSLLSRAQSVTMDTSNPAALTSYLAKRSTNDFPKIPSVGFEVRNVPESMEPYLSPAFYLIPPIDNSDNNVIYLNNGSLTDGLSFFTTLAHESYPGHLYQTIYENETDSHPISRLMYFGGYSEGWATYAEQLSYYYAPIPTDVATLLSTTRAMTLNLYAHLDLYIHGYGWTEEDCSAYLKKFGITAARSIHQMFLLVKQQPANYLKYYLGYLEICNLKSQAKGCLGSDFDLKEFHEFILSSGPAPFELLEVYFKEWLQSQ